MTCETHRLAGIRDFGREEVVETALDPVGDRVQHLDPVGDGEPAPRARQCTARRVHGSVHFASAGLGDPCDDSVVERRTLVEPAAGSDVFAVDKVHDFFHCTIPFDG
jgi:hypothetical protein